MGAFITNLHVRGADRPSVTQTLRSLAAVPAYVSDGPQDAWVSIFPAPADQNPEALRLISRGLSQALGQPVIAFLVHDSDIFLYWLFDQGTERDHYDSAPGYFEGGDVAPEGGNVEVLSRYCAAGTAPVELVRLLHQKEPARARPAPNIAQQQQMKELMLKKLQETYPSMAKQNPKLPSLKTLMEEAEKRFAGLPPLPQSVEGSFLFAEDMARELATHLGIDAGRATDSYRYLEEGEGMTEPLLLVTAESEQPIRLRD